MARSPTVSTSAVSSASRRRRRSSSARTCSASRLGPSSSASSSGGAPVGAGLQHRPLELDRGGLAQQQSRKAAVAVQMRGPSAVHDHRRPGDEGRLRRAQVRDQLGHLVRLDQPLDRRRRQHDLLDDLRLVQAVAGRLRGDLLLDQRRPHVRGVDAVGGDAVRRALQRDHLGQPLQPVLGRHVRRLVRRGAQPVHRGDVDDPAPALRVHVRQAAADQPERRLQHQPQDQRERLRRELVQRRDVLQAGVVDHDVGGRVEPVDRGQVGQVDGPGGAADLARRPGRAASPSRSTTITRAPAPASRSAQARPMPLAPPVTRAVRPARTSSAVSGRWCP